MFSKFFLDCHNNIFDELSDEISFENITGGRIGTVLVDPIINDIPIVRTTTSYEKPAKKFGLCVKNIIKKIQKINGNIKLNNILAEIYNNEYKTMGYHSDQSLDLLEESFICIYSCYSDPNTTNTRTLKIKNKITKEIVNIDMNHNSLIMFSTEINSKHLHKIILEKSNDDVKWLGLTMRCSKTYVNHVDDKVYFENTDTELKLATYEESQYFYKCRSLENKLINYKYPNLNITISKSDLLKPN